MNAYIVENLLVLTKTYPVPSASYRETSCVAAVNDHGDLRRLYPIPYRLLNDNRQFKRWEWMTAKIDRSSDRRPESYRIDVDSIERLRTIGTDNAWADRLAWINPHIIGSFADLEERRQKTGESLGFIRPNNYSLIIEKSNDEDWSDTRKANLNLVSLLDSDKVKNRSPLRKLPFDFYYEYTCNTQSGFQQYKHKITDWEFGMLFWNCLHDYGNNWEEYFRLKVEKEFIEKKEVIFMMGTMHRFPNQWLIVGVIYPPKVEARQQPLFPLTPNA